ncbi:MAG: hypothetical protein ABUT20_49225 [Bacteroidota bacterium]
MRNFFLYLLLIIFSSCNNAENKIQTETNDSDGKQDKEINQSKSGNKNMIQANEIKSISFKYKNDTILQKLVVAYISNKAINFKLITINKTDTSMLVGAAKSHTSNDIETDDDDEGNAYAVDEYHYNNKNCAMSIRIASDKKDKAKVIEYNCDLLHKTNCPFNSLGVLRRDNASQ